MQDEKRLGVTIDNFGGTKAKSSNVIDHNATAGVSSAQQLPLLEYIPESIRPIFNNQFFSAGFGLIGVGAVLTLGRKGFQMGLINARRYMFVSVEIPSRDRSFHWLMEWMALKRNQNTRHVSVETTIHQHENGELQTRMSFIPSVGSHFIWYGGRPIRVERAREKNVVDMSSGALWESITLSTFGFSKSIFHRLLEEARIISAEREEGKTTIYTSQGIEWRKFGHPRRRRPIESVVLDNTISSDIIDDVKQFLSNSNWYSQRGIPYRRGYLLYGPPGTGKSSFITALAGELQLNICILNLSSKGISDSTLNQLLSSTPQRSIVLLEDIDAAINTSSSHSSSSSSSSSTPQQQHQVMQYQYNNQQYQYTAPTASGLTFSGLLNALDGVAASEGRILFMTTNHIHKLDKVLIRPGRVDMTVEIGLASPSQIQGLFLKFFPNDLESAKLFSESITPYSVSPAQLQGYLIKYASSKDDVINHYKELYKDK